LKDHQEDGKGDADDGHGEPQSVVEKVAEGESHAPVLLDLTSVGDLRQRT
jgi:hypothetical protein